MWRNRSTLRQRKLESDAASLRLRPLQAKPFYFVAKKNRIRRGIVAATTCRRRAVILAGTMVLHRFLISGPDLRIDASPRFIPGEIPPARGWSIVPRPGNAGWAGTSDGVAARGFVNGRGPPRSGGRESTAGAHRSEVPARRQTRTRKDVPARRQTRTRRQFKPRRQTRPRRHPAPGTKKRVPTHR